jgi:thiamine kinase-like enzyme
MNISSAGTIKMQIEVIREIAALLIKGDLISLEPIEGGRNSQIYRLIGSDSQTYALKAYFRHPSDNCDRLRTEFSSLCFLWENGIRNIPQPIAVDWEQGCALYEYIEGQRVMIEEITDTEVDVAIRFLVNLKELKDRARSYNLPSAAEACFSVKAIVENIQQRLGLLIGQSTSEESYKDLNEFLNHDLMPRLKEIVCWSQTSLRRAHMSFDLDIDPTERTLSPSDFGFHNALKRSNGQLVFLDFEYFGWDDPAKMVADILLHPGMNLREGLKQRFAHGILQRFSDYPYLAKRVEIVYPLFGLKWCLILLNEFLPQHLLRRRFASANGLKRHILQTEQLAKAKRLLQMVSENYEHFSYFD